MNHHSLYCQACPNGAPSVSDDPRYRAAIAAKNEPKWIILSEMYINKIGAYTILRDISFVDRLLFVFIEQGWSIKYI